MTIITQEFLDAKDELVCDARQADNRICRIKGASGYFVKSRYSYSHPEGVRMLFIQAFDALVQEGTFKLVMRTPQLELYELISSSGAMPSVADAREILLEQARRTGSVFKIHGADGEFVQTDSRAFCGTEGERTIFLKALGELIHSGELHPVWDTKELARFVVGWAMTSQPVALVELKAVPAQAA